MLKLHELLAKRAAALKAWKAILEKAETETRDLNAEEETRETTLKAEIADLDKKIERARAMQEAERAAPAIVENVGDGDFAERARKDFRITRAIAATFDSSVDAGLERELGQEVARRTGRKFQGIAVPDEALAPLQQRTLTTSGDGAPLVPTQHRPDLFIDVPRPSLILPALGATLLDGLVGVQEIPKQVGSSVASWLDEEEELSESDPVFDDVSLTPRTVGALTSFSRRMLINAVPSIENLVRRDLAAVIANAVDLAALGGDGTNGQPIGITAHPDVHTIALAGGDWQLVLDMIARVEASNLLGGSLGWAMSPGVKARLRASPKSPGEGEGYVMEGPTDLAGYRAATTSSLPGDPTDSPQPSPSVLIFGDWTQVLLGSWSGVDILANPYEGEAYKRGRVLVRAMRDVDVALRHGQAFAVCDDIMTAVSA